MWRGRPWVLGSYSMEPICGLLPILMYSGYQDATEGQPTAVAEESRPPEILLQLKGGLGSQSL